jgi:hypothetical protein
MLTPLTIVVNYTTPIKTKSIKIYITIATAIKKNMLFATNKKHVGSTIFF